MQNRTHPAREEDMSRKGENQCMLVFDSVDSNYAKKICFPTCPLNDVMFFEKKDVETHENIYHINIFPGFIFTTYLLPVKRIRLSTM